MSQTGDDSIFDRSWSENNAVRYPGDLRCHRQWYLSF